MLPCRSTTLSNGLRLVIQRDLGRTLAVVNLMYLVGSRDEAPERTGLAHLLEHIMFGGSRHVPSYDAALQEVGGCNNAYTCQDVTNYWCRLPVEKLEVAFWLESDRLLAPLYEERVVEVQRRVVLEEFQQGLDRPYGDVWHLLLAQAYRVSPYAWPTIGKRMEHVARVTRKEIARFGRRFYQPNCLALSVVGDVNCDRVVAMAEKWFGGIPAGEPPVALPQEPAQSTACVQQVVADVPHNRLYKTYHIPGRASPDYAGLLVLATLWGAGASSLFHRVLVEEQALFSSVDVSMTESMNEGLLVIAGALQEGVSFVRAERALGQLMDRVVTYRVGDRVLQKAKNQRMAAHLSTRMDALAWAEQLAEACLLGSVDFFEQEHARVMALQASSLQLLAGRVLDARRSHTLYYGRAA